VSTPASPFLLGSTAIPGRIARDVTVVGSLAYVADQSSKFFVFDVSAPGAPAVINGVTGLTLAGPANHIAVQGSLAAVIVQTSSGDYLQVIDISSPTAPFLLGSPVLLGPTGDNGGIALNNGRAYIAAGQAGLKTYDLSSPESPVLLSTVKTVGAASTVTIQGHFAYVGDLPATVDAIDLNAP
jgi:hypothetical protein